MASVNHTSDIQGVRQETYHRHLGLTIFVGEDLIEWVFRVESYFIINRLTKNENMTTTIICMKGIALN